MQYSLVTYTRLVTNMMYRTKTVALDERYFPIIEQHYKNGLSTLACMDKILKVFNPEA